jgi:hypothetical protein
MRTGVLADSEAKHFFPMDQIAHERHLGVAHIVKHTRTTRKRKQGYRVTPRPRAPYIAHWELAQLMNPDNVRESLPAFSTHMDATMRPRPPHHFKTRVADFKRQYPELANRAILDETAYFFASTGLSPMPFFSLPRSARKPLHIIVEEAIAFEGRADELESAYNEAMRLLLSEADAEVRLEPQVKVEMEPDGVPSKTDARFEKAQASGKKAREEKVNEMRNMDGTQQSPSADYSY